MASGMSARTRNSEPRPSSGPAWWRVSGPGVRHLCLPRRLRGADLDAWGLVGQGAHCTQSTLQAEQAAGCAGCEWHLDRRPVQLRVVLCLSAQLRLLLNPDFRAAREPGRWRGSPPHSCCCSHFTEEETEAPSLAGWG